MSTPRYVISTTFRGRTRTETWDADAPLMIGRTKKGPLWVIENVADGNVRVRSLGVEVGEISEAFSKILQADQIRTGVQVKFKKLDSDEIKLEIRAMRDLRPQFYRSTGALDFSNGFLVYHCVGNWNTESTLHAKEFVGSLYGDTLFRVVAEGRSARLIAEKSGLLLELDGRVQELSSFEETILSAGEFFKGGIRFGQASWYFGSPSHVRKEATFEIPDRPYENRDFVRYASGTLIALLLFFGAASLVPKPVKEDVISPQILKVLVQRQRHLQKSSEISTDSKKNPDTTKLVGEKRDATEKPIAQVENPTAPPKSSDSVPKGSNGGNKPSVARTNPAHANRASNLIQGLMRGGLMKITDNHQLLQSAKLGSGGLTKGDSSTVTSALSNIAVNMNAPTVGKNGKVVGFGGDSESGARGAATAGYSNGVKGAITAFAGGDGISLGTSEAEVEEGLTKEEVGRVIHAHMKEVRYCYESSVVRASKVDGRVVLDFTINGKGVVSKIKVTNSSLPDPALGECIMRRLKTWAFPNPKGGVNVDVAYPFIFKTLGG